VSLSSPVTAAQRSALLALGLRDDQIPMFLSGEAVVYLLKTQGQAGIAIIQKSETRLRSGVVEVNDRGGGPLTFRRFYVRSIEVAQCFELIELELFGAAVMNRQLEEGLQKRGFERRTERCPDELGGGEMEILTRVEVVGA
jgi:hypothetical protein